MRFELSKFWPNRRFLMLFHEKRHFLQLFSEKFVKTSKLDSFPKSLSKPRNLIVCSKSWKFWPNRSFFMLFHEMSHFLQLFSEKFMETSTRNSFLEKVQVLAKSMIFHAFSRNEKLFDKIQPIAPDERAHPKASSLLVILLEPLYLKYDRLDSSTLFCIENPREHS